MARPATNPNTILAQGVFEAVKAYLSEPSTFAGIAEAAGYQPQGGGAGADKIVTLDPLGDVIGEIENPHPMTETALHMVRRSGLYLYGPAGSGKSTIAINVAKALGVSAFVQGRTESEFQIFGFRDGRGEYRPTAFRRAFEQGGLYCLDEMDRCDATALTALNDALSSGRALFPDGEMIEAHSDFYFIATGNTSLRGDEAGFTAAVEHDSAVADRLAFLRIDYDEDFERSLVPARFGYWVDRVQAIRKASEAIGAAVQATPRASIRGAEMLHDGIKQGVVEDALIWRGIDSETKDQVSKRAAAEFEEEC